MYEILRKKVDIYEKYIIGVAEGKGFMDPSANEKAASEVLKKAKQITIRRKKMKRFIVDKIEDNEDGSATMTFTADDDVMASFIREGFRVIVEETKAKVVVLPPVQPFTEDAKKYELTDEEAQLLIQMGVISALKRGLEGMEENDKE